MPFKDKTGPRGRESVTGRGRGFCGNRNRDTGMSRVGGGMGRGRGRGRGRGGQRGPGSVEPGVGFVDAPMRDPSHELNALRAESAKLKELLESIEQRLSRLGATENER